jgi:hypothetical protein
MTIQTVDCIQGSDEWYRVRMGMPTASEFATILAKGRDGGASVTRRKYLLTLAGERITGEPAETFSNGHMERGKIMEDEARDLYSLMAGVDPQRVGFIINGPKGCSPDALIGHNGMVEIKTKLPHLVIDCILKDEFPPEHKAQCQGALWVAEREWIDIAIYWPRLPLFLKRAYRDDGYIANLAGAVSQFNDELVATVERVRNYQNIQVAA